MGRKVPVNQVNELIEESDDWSDGLEDDDIVRTKVRYNSKRRRDIEDIMEERLLARQLRDGYDEHS